MNVKKLVPNKIERISGKSPKSPKSPKKKSPYKQGKVMINNNKNNLNISFPGKGLHYFESSPNNFLHDITEERGKKLPGMSKNAYIGKLNNSINSFAFNDNTYIFPMNNRDISILTDSNIFDSNSTNSNTSASKNHKTIIKRNLTNQNLKTKNKNRSVNNNINTSLISNKNANTIVDLPYQKEPFDSRYSIKINKIKDDYIDFLQKEFEDNTKKSVKLDSNNKELLKKCDDLIHDNKILTNSLNDRTNKLNKIIQENLMVKSQLDKTMLSNEKNEQKLQFYEEQFNLFKTSNENYQKIIKELKEQNDQLNAHLIEIEKKNVENLKKVEESYQNNLKEEVEKAKNEVETIYNNKNMEENKKNEKNTQAFLEQIKALEEKNDQLMNDLTKKDNMFDIVCKENEKLTSENNVFRTQVDQFSHQISELNTIIKHKDNIINNLKKEYLSNDKFLNKSSSCSMMKFDGSEYINENISKLITDNEENKMKIELLNDKIKSIDEIEKKYNEIMNGARTFALSEKLAFHINSNNTSPKSLSTHTHFNFNSNDLNNGNNFNNYTNKKVNTGNKYIIKNNTNTKANANTKTTKINNRNNTSTKVLTNRGNTYQSFISPKKLQLIDEFNESTHTPIYGKNKYEKTENNNFLKDMKPNKNKGNNVVVYSSNVTKDNKIKNIIKPTNVNSNIEIKERNKSNFDREIKVTKKINKPPEKDTKDNKNISKTRKVEISTTPIKGRYYHKIEENKNKANQEKNSHIKEIDLEKDLLKESLREIDRKKNYTHNPKNLNYSLDEIVQHEHKTGEKLLTIGHSNIDKIVEDKKGEQNTLYLYGIDRNDIFHIFDVNEKKWCDMKKISELEDKSQTFKRDYQYEGTLLYNILSGVYILTGEKTDTLYFYNSQTNCITKICKFNNCHDNGSIMLDTKSNCIYVFGGKKINSCEFYSFNDKKVYKLPDLITDRANASFIISNNKIFGFFGFSYSKNNYAKSIEYIDYTKKDKWVELKNIQFLKPDISFDTESVSTMYYRQNPNQILIYCGIHGEEEDFVTEYYLLYDAKNNTMDKINKWNIQQFKSFGKRWKPYNLKKTDPKGFHFAKNNRFILLPRGNIYEGYNERDPIDILIDYKNNVHYILQEKQKIDIYRNDL